jgi:hypothetical protein
MKEKGGRKSVGMIAYKKDKALAPYINIYFDILI